MTAIAPLAIDQHTDWTVVLTLPALPVVPGGTWSARCQIRDDDLLLVEPTATVLTGGLVRLELNNTQTGLNAGVYAYDLLIESPQGDRSKVFTGVVTIFATKTRWGPLPAPPELQPTPTPDWLTEVVTGAIANHNANLAAHPGLAGGGGSVQTRTVFTPSNGQTVFTLAAVPALPHLSQLFLNGVKARFTLDYTINGAIINWQNRVQLGVSDEFEVFYQ
jgi:hypothetical protein